MATRPHRSFLRMAAVIAAAAPVLVSSAVRADEPAPKSNDWENEPATRRSGFVVGLAAGVGLSSIAGYPNDVRKMGFARYYTETGARPAGTGSLWIGGALTDWFTFGIGFGGGQLFAIGDDSATAGGILFHLEAFPLLPFGGKLRDLGVMMDAGTGAVSVVAKDGETKKVDSGAASLIGGGVFWEGVRFWRIRGGPFLMGNYMWSDSARRPGIFLGWRMSLYTGPSKPAP